MLSSELRLALSLSFADWSAFNFFSALKFVIILCHITKYYVDYGKIALLKNGNGNDEK